MLLIHLNHEFCRTSWSKYNRRTPMPLTDILISLFGGFAAGFLNSLAGFGSIITLAIYMDIMNIPGHIANGTNRVNVFASSSVSTLTYYKNGLFNFEKGKSIIAIVVLGALIGVAMAVNMDSEQFKNAYKYLLIPILMLLLVNPQRFITPDTSSPPSPKWMTMSIYFLFGIYAGFIQVGFGVMFLLIVVMMDKYDLIKANAMKVAIVAIYTVVVIVIFHLQGLIQWQAGLLVAVGQAAGGYLAARMASRMEGANKYAYYLIIIIVILVIIKNFELWKIFT